MPPTATCTMPEHGSPDAPHPCCRPAPAAPAAPTPARARLRSPGFWTEGRLWRRSGVNTAHCLLGCAIGDIAAMTLVPLVWPAIPMLLLMGIAILCGIATSLALETLVLRLREGFPWRRALEAAFRMSIVSMVAMEIAMNVTDWIAMGGTRLPVHHAGYWLAWIPALAAGFLVPWPYGYAMLKRHGRSCH